MYLSKWINDKKILSKLFQNFSKKINVISFVDSHGALVPEQIKKFLREVKNKNVHKIKIGTHFHN